MTHQLRMYTINRGQMDEFVRVWREKVVPLREKLGFRVVSAWINPSTNQFIWIVSYDGPLSWDDANKAYYDLPERQALVPSPVDFIARMELSLVNPVM